MSDLLTFFDINNTFFTLLGYPISYLEFTGTLFNLVCVILVARRNIWTWPIGLVGVVLFGILFYQINLYSDFFEQIFYFVTGLWGWYMWNNTKQIDETDNKVEVEANSVRTNLLWLYGITIVGLAAGLFMSRIHQLLPALFPEPASLPYLDAITTVMSFAAQILMMQRKLENWVLWFIVDVIAIGLYAYKQVPFVALLYAILLVNAVYGYVSWRRKIAIDVPKEG